MPIHYFSAYSFDRNAWTRGLVRGDTIDEARSRAEESVPRGYRVEHVVNVESLMDGNDYCEPIP